MFVLNGDTDIATLVKAMVMYPNQANSALLIAFRDSNLRHFISQTNIRAI